jgi:hypothetical protein
MCFVTYLSQIKKRDGRPLSHTTIDQYVTHTIFYLTNIGVIDSTFDFRCPGTKRLLNAVERRDAHLRGPLRERISIALSLPLINRCIDMAQETYQCKITVAFITAALYFGYMFSVRPDDYLVPVADDFHRIRACSIAFWFFGYSKPFFVHQLRPPFQFPPSGSLPVRCSVIIDFDKANGSGTAGMRACCANPIPGQFCFVSWLYNFFILFPVQDEFTAVFGAIPSRINRSDRFLYTCFRETLRLTAIRLGLRVTQLVPRGARSGATAQIRGSGGTQADCKSSGGWHSDACLLYERPDWSVAVRCAAAMHNTSAVDLDMLQYVHSTACPPSLSSKV